MTYTVSSGTLNPTQLTKIMSGGHLPATDDDNDDSYKDLKYNNTAFAAHARL